jgi:hypothetical protein
MNLRLTFDYDRRRWPFAEAISDIVGVDRLDLLHEGLEGRSVVEVAETGLALSAWLRDSLSNRFLGLVRDFMHQGLPASLGTVTRYQESPVMRVHMHGGHSVSGFHRDRDWGQRSSVLNLWLPFTDVCDSNSLWVESAEGAGDLTPVSLRYGQALVFSGADLLHGSRRNTSGATRVSCDIRFHVRPG